MTARVSKAINRVTVGPMVVGVGVIARVFDAINGLVAALFATLDGPATGLVIAV